MKNGNGYNERENPPAIRYYATLDLPCDNTFKNAIWNDKFK